MNSIVASLNNLAVQKVSAISAYWNPRWAQPLMTFDGDDLYPTLVDKASALCFSLVKNHPFLDGNKRVGHAAMETFLILNGHEISGLVQDQEEAILSLAAGELSRDAFSDWLQGHIQLKQ